jgi:hypothetical protein
LVVSAERSPTTDQAAELDELVSALGYEPAEPVGEGTAATPAASEGSAALTVDVEPALAAGSNGHARGAVYDPAASVADVAAGRPSVGYDPAGDLDVPASGGSAARGRDATADRSRNGAGAGVDDPRHEEPPADPAADTSDRLPDPARDEPASDVDADGRRGEAGPPLVPPAGEPATEPELEPEPEAVADAQVVTGPSEVEPVSPETDGPEPLDGSSAGPSDRSEPADLWAGGGSWASPSGEHVTGRHTAVPPGSAPLSAPVAFAPSPAPTAPPVTVPGGAEVAPVTDSPPGTGTAPVLPTGRIRRRRMIRSRKVRRVIRHIDPWSVLTFSVIFHLCLFGALLLAGTLVWSAAEASGTINNVESFIRDLGDYDTWEIQGESVLRAGIIIAGMLTLASTVLVVLLAVVFNLISDLIGGIRVTVIEEEVHRVPVARRK